MSLTAKDLSNLVSHLHPDRVAEQSLETITSVISKQFHKSDHFKICRILTFLLQYDFLYNTVSQFVALFLIWEMQKSEPFNTSPFTNFLSGYLQDQVTLPPGVIFVLHKLLTQPEQMHEFMKCTPQQIVGLTNPNMNAKLDWSFIQRSTAPVGLPKNVTCGITCVVPDQDVSPSGSLFTPTEQQQRACLDSVLGDNCLLDGDDLRPETLRVAPPLLSCPQGVPRAIRPPDSPDPKDELSGWLEELIWLNPTAIQHQFHWDSTAGRTNPTSELRHLMYIAFTSSLPQAQVHTVLQAIKDNPAAMLSVGVTPDNLPVLIERNPVIAFELLPLLVKSPQKIDFYNALVSMEVTVNSLESVNRLTTKLDLPTEFIHRYVSKCMQACQSIADKGVQTRHVRLVCVLIQSLIRNRILVLSNENILIEVQAFCVDFMKVGAASTLYRLIKNMETSTSLSSAFVGPSGNGGDTSPGT